MTQATQGVIGLNSELLTEEIYNIVNEIDLSWEIAYAELSKSDEFDEGSFYDMFDSTEYLFGDWLRIDDKSSHYGFRYEIDKNGKNGFAGSYDNNTNVIVIEYSQWVTECAPTSPCYRDGRTGGPCGDLDNEGYVTAYSLPDYLFTGNIRKTVNA